MAATIVEAARGLATDVIDHGIRSCGRAPEIGIRASPCLAKYQRGCDTDHTRGATWVGNITAEQSHCAGGVAVQYFFIISWALAVFVALAPLALFLVVGWRAREAE